MCSWIRVKIRTFNYENYTFGDYVTSRWRPFKARCICILLKFPFFPMKFQNLLCNCNCYITMFLPLHWNLQQENIYAFHIIISHRLNMNSSIAGAEYSWNKQLWKHIKRWSRLFKSLIFQTTQYNFNINQDSVNYMVAFYFTQLLLPKL